MKSLARVTALEFPAGTPFKERVRVSWELLRFVYRYNRMTPEQQDRVRQFLASQPGVTVTEREA